MCPSKCVTVDYFSFPYHALQWHWYAITALIQTYNRVDVLLSSEPLHCMTVGVCVCVCICGSFWKHVGVQSICSLYSSCEQCASLQMFTTPMGNIPNPAPQSSASDLAHDALSWLMSERSDTRVRVALCHLDIAAVEITMPARGVEQGRDGRRPWCNPSLYPGKAVSEVYWTL